MAFTPALRWSGSGSPTCRQRPVDRSTTGSISFERRGLRPHYWQLLALGPSVGDDVKACPCKTIVPLYRKHVFAQIKATTATRLDFGLALRDTPAEGKLIDTGGFAKKDRITHRFAIASAADIDGEVKTWLRRAYEMDA